MAKASKGQPVETPWIDAWIRWERNENTVDQEEEDNNDPVAATDTFSFPYVMDPKPDITIELRGFPSDSEQTWNSTGLTLWRSSQHLCDHLVKEWKKCDEGESSTTGNLFTDNTRFLEVGSGLGRSGILAYHLLSRISPSPCGEDDNNKKGRANDRLLCLTDGDTDVLHHLRNNVEHNQPAQHKNNVTLVCSQLIWGRDRALAFLQRQADSRRFDVIFGSDLIYVQKVIQPLFETVSTLLEEFGCFIMAHCARREGNEVNVSMVFDVADSFGLQHDIVEEDHDITVIVFRQKS